MRAALVTAVLVAVAVGLYFSLPAGGATFGPPVELGSGLPGGAARAVFTPDGRHIALIRPTGQLAVVEVATGRRLAVLGDEAKPDPRPWAAAGLAVSPDGRLIAAPVPVPGPDGTTRPGPQLRLWDWAAGRELARAPTGPNPPLGLAFAPDGHTLAGESPEGDRGGFQPTVRLWDVPTLTERWVSRRAAPRSLGLWDRSDLGFDPADGTVVVWAGGVLRRLDPATGAVRLDRLVEHARGGTAATPDGLLWCCAKPRPDPRRSGGPPTDLGVRRGTDGEEVAVTAAPGDRYGATAALSPDGRRLASHTLHRGGVTVFGLPGLTRLTHLPGVGGDLAFSPAGDALLAQSDDLDMGLTTHLRLFDVASGRQRLVVGEHVTGPWSVAVRPDGRAAASVDNVRVVLTWNLDTGAATASYHTFGLGGRGPTSLSYTPDGKQLALAEGDRVSLLDPDSGAVVGTFDGHTGPVWAASFCRDGSRLASAGGTELIVWDTTSRRPLRTVSGLPGRVDSVVLSPDGRRVAVGCNSQVAGTLRLDGSEPPTVTEPEMVRVWDVATGREVVSLPGHQQCSVSAVAFSPDGHTLAHTGLIGGRARLVDVASGRTRRELPAGNAAVVAFSPDGQTLATAGRGGRVRLWDTTTGRLVAECVGHGGESVRGLAFTPDGRRLLTGGGDKRLLLWELPR